MKPYEKYKSTDIPWLPIIPEHWTSLRVKNMYKKERRPVPFDSSTVTCFRDGIVTLRTNRRTTGFTESSREYGYQGVFVGDLVIHEMDAFAGAIGVSDSNGKCTPVYSCCIALGEYDNYYYAYLLREMARRGYIQSLYRGIRERSSDFRFDILGKQTVVIPPYSEQRQIKRYLDIKVSKIVRLIVFKKKQIKLLEEQKRAVINNAVTRGINPDASMKDSNINWLGHIPNKWTVKKIKWLFKERVEKNKENEQLLVASKYVGVIPLKDYCNRTVVASKDLHLLKFVKIEDFIISLRSFQSGIEYAHSQGIISPAYTIITADKEVLYPLFFKYLGKCASFIKLLTTCVTGIREGQNINFAVLKNHYLPLPSLNEQQSIVAYLDKKCNDIYSSISNIKQEIALLQEYKISLISNVVTGQIDVRHIAVPETEPIAEQEEDEEEQIIDEEGDTDAN